MACMWICNMLGIKCRGGRLGMSCKHKQVIRIVNNKQEYYCTAKQKEITEHDCKGCMLYNEKLDDDLQGLVNLFFGGFKK